jgi:hypothetical protein
MKIVFKNILVNGQGEAVEEDAKSFRELINPCDFVQLNQFLAEVDEARNMSGTSMEVISTKFKIDSLFFKDIWQNCVNEIQGFIQSNKQYGEHMSLTCAAAIGTPEYDLDPCCSAKGAWSHACIPREIEGEYTHTSRKLTLTGIYTNNTIREDMLENQCLHPSCAKSFLGDYLSAKDIQCPNFATELSSLLPQMRILQRNCYQQALGTSSFVPWDSVAIQGLGPFACLSDSDCTRKYCYWRRLTYRSNKFYMRFITPKMPCN